MTVFTHPKSFGLELIGCLGGTLILLKQKNLLGLYWAHDGCIDSSEHEPFEDYWFCGEDDTNLYRLNRSSWEKFEDIVSESLADESDKSKFLAAARMNIGRD